MNYKWNKEDNRWSCVDDSTNKIKGYVLGKFESNGTAYFEAYVTPGGMYATTRLGIYYILRNAIKDVENHKVEDAQ